MENSSNPTITSASAPTVPQIERLTYTKRELAGALGISETQVWRLERDGLLRPLSGIRHKRYSVAEVQKYLAGKTGRAAA